MTEGPGDDAGRPGDGDFDARRDKARQRLETLPGATSEAAGERRTWFEQVYELAGDDPAAVPWADLAPKPALLDWLARNPGRASESESESRSGLGAGRQLRAIDIACGLGDNAEALAAAGYRTTAFDLAAGAIDWARRRFADSPVTYCVADLFDPPPEWRGAFDLVHETYTIQALRGDLRAQAFAAIAALAAPGATLLVVCRSREDDAIVQGPPWPLSPSELSAFERLGFERISRRSFTVVRPDREIPHLETVYRKIG